MILPSQISVDARWVSDTSGPIALMLAVLEEAARCIERGRRRRHPGIRKLAAEAEAWVRCDSREWPFAFASICDVLGLDVDAARARFLADGQNRTGGRRAAGLAHCARTGTNDGLPCPRGVAGRVIFSPRGAAWAMPTGSSTPPSPSRWIETAPCSSSTTITGCNGLPARRRPDCDAVGINQHCDSSGETFG